MADSVDSARCELAAVLADARGENSHAAAARGVIHWDYQLKLCCTIPNCQRVENRLSAESVQPRRQSRENGAKVARVTPKSHRNSPARFASSLEVG